ncbi:hypothetical protein JJQ59_35265 (plasmid) [Cupriavidus necator]|uniref:Uncharacterized protein n=1 Tax=Cupriavidus necator TaxID=106590 RepID=A0A367PLC2_CUPNE|nr:hypothetical protein [Cupriavidus necator]QQX89772.1 hypothetical protein JJQ59_35265 [Cupriavidus necator]RCJ08353.1 hypothetical protein DDK22_11355 [Cupriavidus necator]
MSSTRSLQPRPPISGDDATRDRNNFSLVLGGPLYQLLCRAHLSDDALLLVRQRIAFIALFSWLPLLLLSALEGSLLGKGGVLPFLKDIEVHLRFLVAVPLLIAAEPVVHQRMRGIGQTFLERNLVPGAARDRFDAAIGAALRLRNSVLAEALLVAFVYGVGVLVVWRHYTALQASTWYATSSAGNSKLSLAGAWYGYVSLPIFQFLLIRWYFRLFIWIRFLWQVSRIKLSIIPTHPDRVGGLGFLSNTVYAFALLLAAHGVMLAANLGNRILFLGAALPEFKMEIGVMAIFLLAVVFGPLLVFAPQLAQAKRKGLNEYGTLAERYVREFDTKWLRGGVSADEPLVGSSDIQSLADLGNSFEVVRGMRLAPITRDAIVQLAAAVLIPVVPLALTMMPLEELLKHLFGLLF